MCAVLGHKNIKRTLQYHIDDNRKKFIGDVRQEVVCETHTNSIGQNNLKNLTYYTGKATGEKYNTSWSIIFLYRLYCYEN